MAQPQTIESEPLEAPRPNKAHINEHLYALFAPEFVKDYPDARIEIAYASPATDDGRPQRCEHFSVFEIEKAADFAERKNQAGFNVYVGAALRDGKSGERQVDRGKLRDGLSRLGGLRRRRR